MYLHNGSLKLTCTGLHALRPSVISVSVANTSTIFVPNLAERGLRSEIWDYLSPIFVWGALRFQLQRTVESTPPLIAPIQTPSPTSSLAALRYPRGTPRRSKEHNSSFRAAFSRSVPLCCQRCSVESQKRFWYKCQFQDTGSGY